MKVKKRCLFCNRKMFVYPSVVRQGKGKFCSRKCSSQWISENLSGKNNKKWNHIAKVCDFCRGTFEVNLSRRDAKYCSQICYGNSKKGKRPETYQRIKKNVLFAEKVFGLVVVEKTVATVLVNVYMLTMVEKFQEKGIIYGKVD